MKLKNYPRRHFERQYHSRLYGWRDHYSDGPDMDDDDVGCLMEVLAPVIILIVYCMCPPIGVIFGIIACGIGLRIAYVKRVEKQNADNLRNHLAKMTTKNIQPQHERENHHQR